MTIYQELQAADIPIDHYESTLYAKITPESEKIIENYRWKEHVSRFMSQIDNTMWFDIPFAYDPFWKDSIVKGELTKHDYKIPPQENY